MSSKFLNTNIDETLGGNNPSDTAVPSQKAVKTYVDNKELAGLKDVNINSPTQGQNLTYDAINDKWINTSTTATVAWGGITGNLTDQSDLVNALADKQDTLTGINAGNNITITSALPSGYTQLEYIESTGTQYLDTGVSPAVIGRVVSDFAFTTSATRECALGSWSSKGPTYFLYKVTYLTLVSISTNVLSSIAPVINTFYNVDANLIDGYYKIDDTVVGTFTSSSNTSTQSLYVFASNDADEGAYTKAHAKLKTLKIYDKNNVLINNFIPAKRNSDNVVGLYDAINNTFIINSGTGTLVAGSEVETSPIISSTNTTYTAGSNITISDNVISGAYLTGTSSTSGLTKLYTSTGSNTDGTMTQSALTSQLNNKITFNSLNQDLNSFGNSKTKTFTSSIHNAFYCINKRNNVTVTTTGFSSTTNVDKFFDSSFEDYPNDIPAGNTGVVTIDGSVNTYGIINGYCYGSIYLSFYYNWAPTSTSQITVEIQEKNGNWITVPNSNIYITNSSTISGTSYIEVAQVYLPASLSGYSISTEIKQIRITIDNTAGSDRISLTEIEHFLGRPNSISDFPVVTKFTDSEIFGNVTATSHITKNGTSSQFVKGDGSLDSNTYITSSYHDSTKQDVLTAGTDIDITNNTISFSNDTGYITASEVPEEVFIATYDTTTFAELTAAYNAGKLCMVNDGSRLIPLTTITSSIARFFGLITAVSISKITLNSSNTWATTTLNITASGMTADRAMITDANGYSTASDITTTELNYLDGVTSNIQTQLNSKQNSLTAGSNIQINNNTISATDTTYSAGSGLTLTGTEFSANVEDNVTSTSTTNALSANMGKELQDQISNLKARGRYLSVWNCTTGLAETSPTTLPYTYKTGDYFIVGVVGSSNLKPNGATYTGTASVTAETGTVAVNDTYYYDGTTWTLFHGADATVTFANIAGQPTDNANLATALNSKQATLTAGTNINITNNTISATDTTYTGGTDISIGSDNSINFTGTIPTAISDLTNDSCVSYSASQSLTNVQKALAKANIDASRITDQVIARSWTYANFTTYGTYGRSETWTLDDKSKVIVGDIFTINVTITDRNNAKGYIFIQVTDLSASLGSSNVQGTTLLSCTPFIPDMSTKQDVLTAGTDISITNNTISFTGTIPTKVSDLTDDTATYPVDKADTLTNLTATVSELNVLDGITATTAELNYTDGVTSNIQTQLNAKVNTSDVDSAVKYNTTNPVQSKAITEYIASRGENLVTNGNQLLGNNYNWSSFTYDPSDSNGSAGCIKSSVINSIAFCNEKIPVDTTQTYHMSFDIKTDNGSARFYDTIQSYDIDGYEVMYNNVYWISGSTTTLAQELKAGDTKVYLTSVAGFNKTTVQSYQRGFIFWNYTNSKGYTWPTETYSRNRYANLWADSSAFDTEENSITLTNAWTGPTIEAGTSLSQCTNGANYIYIGNTNYTLTADTWVHRDSVLTPSLFRKGTAYVSVGWLLNREVSEVTTKWTNICFSQKANYSDLPTNISDLTDDTATYPIDKADTLTGLTATVAELNYTDGVTSNIQTQLNAKQATLVSGTNIKTINNNSLLGSGNIEIQSAPETDDETISLNSSDELQAIGVIDSRDSSTALKTWTGTKAQYDAIATKDNNTLYTVTDDIVTEFIDLPFVTLASSGTVSLTADTVYYMSCTGTTTFSLPTVTDNKFHQILIDFTMASAQTVTWGTSNYFNKTAPDITSAGAYTIVYEYSKALGAWVVGAISKGA